VVVSLGRGVRTIKHAVAELGRQQGKVQLVCDPDLDNQAAVAWARSRPLAEVMEAVALAGQFDWKPTSEGYRLTPRTTPFPPKTPVLPFAPSNAVPALAAARPWPPALPDVNEDELRKNCAAPEVDDYPPGSWGAAVAALAAGGDLSLVVVSPALRKSAHFSNSQIKVLPVTGANILHRLSSKDGAPWQRVGDCYTLVPPSKLIALRRTPEIERERKIKRDLDALAQSLTPQQSERLRGGQPLGFDQLEPEQLSLMGSIARLHYSLYSTHDMDLVQNPKGWTLQREGTKSLIFSLEPGRSSPVVEREW
jgi:hypothetical protein